MTANLQRLKRRASDFEQKKQLERALELYTQFLDEAGRDIPDDDIPLFNRVGDLLVRRGDVSEALAYYERAVDMYAERGFLNNAIALCSKILRQSPGRATIYYKLGKISARKGFKSDARKNFLEYADRMQKAGQRDEAFRALKEFASLFPDQDDIRLMLADLLSRENRKGEALEQLQALHEKLESEGRRAEARATIDRMKAIDPDVQPRVSGVQVAQQPNALVFLDVTGGEPAPRREPTPRAVSPQSPPQGLAPALDGLRITFVPDEESAGATTGATSAAAEPEVAAKAPAETATARDAEPPPESELPPARRESRRPEWTGDFELPARLATVDLDLPDESRAAASARPIDGFEPTTLADAAESDQGDGADRDDVQTDDRTPRETRTTAPESVTPGTDDVDEAQPLSTSAFAELPLTEIARPAASRAHDLALPSALPHLGESGDMASDTPPAVTPIDATSVESEGDAPEAQRPPDARPIDELVSWHTAEIPVAGTSDKAAGDGERAPSAENVETTALDGPPENSFALSTVEEASAIDLDDLLATPPSFGQLPSDGTSLFPPLAGLTADAPPQGLAPLEDLDDFRNALDVDVESEGAEEANAARVSASEGGASTQGTASEDGHEIAETSAAASADAPPARTTPRHVPTPRAVLSIGGAEGHLQQRVELEPENWSLRRRLGEALLDAGDREGGLYELELALVGFELEGNLDRATETADVIIRVVPGSVRHHQKRVEYAVRAKDRVRLIAAYLELADALFRTGASEKSVAVYARVAELDPDNERAIFALATLAPDRLLALRGDASRPGRWSEELAAIDDGEPLRSAGGEATAAAPAPTAASPTDASTVPDESTSGDAPAAQDGADAPTTAITTTAATGPSEPGHPAETLESIDAFAPDDEDAAEGEAAHADAPVSDGATARAPTRDAARHPAAPPVAPSIETPAVLRAIDSGANGTTPPATRPVPSAPSRQGHPSSETGQSGFIDLGEWLRDTEPAKSTRMVVEDAKPTGDEQADFAELLRRFKRGLADNVDAEDFAAHYDLGVAFKEMGLIDEAIAEFQKSLRGTEHRVRSYEALGQCFVEKGQYPIAAALLQRAIETPGTDDQQLVGVLYLLGFACEHLGRHGDALRYYQRVFAVDIEFRDIAQRVSSMEHLTK